MGYSTNKEVMEREDLRMEARKTNITIVNVSFIFSLINCEFDLISCKGLTFEEVS